MVNLKVGIISQTLVQQHHLRHIVEECGCEVSTVWLINQLLDNPTVLDEKQSIDAWLVDVDTSSLSQTKNSQLFERWLFDLKEPIIFGEGNTYNAVEASFNSWVRQLTEKLLSVSGQLSLVQQQQKPAEFVWALCASTGGPEAVKSFLDRLPNGLGVAFVYVQHIESRQSSTLANTISRDSRYRGQMAVHGDILCADTVTIVPSAHQLDILADGTLVVRSEPWRGKYQPSIDQIVATIAERFGNRGGAIFFSGMGDDGTVGARLLSRRHGHVWVQAPATCASDAMPTAINKTGCVTTTGSPEQLADYFKHAFKEKAELEVVT